MRIAVVGSGLGGTTVASYLQRFGHEVAVFEQAPRLERIGAGIGLSPNVTRIFGDMGVFARMEAIGMLPRERHGRDGATGELSFAVPVDQFPQQYGAPQMFMHRGDLLDILASTLAPGTIRLGKRLVDAEDGASGVRLRFADGSIAEADVAIGADGINSRLREIALDPSPPFYAGEVAHRAIYPRHLLGDLAVSDLTKWWGPDRYVMVYFITRSREDVYFVTGAPQAEWTAERFAPIETERADLLAAFETFCPEVRRVLETAPAVTTWPICERDPAPGWSRGRIVLLGDACHPMQPHMGQGAAMAIEDAVVLARCLARDADPLDAFARYEALRFDRASRVQLGSRTNNWMRYGMDADWLYGYDAVTVPLEG